jgi:hypothetical protein
MADFYVSISAHRRPLPARTTPITHSLIESIDNGTIGCNQLWIELSK